MEDAVKHFLKFIAGASVAAAVAPASAATLIPVPPVPGSDYTIASAINDNNVITGVYATSDGVLHGFLGTLDGNYTTFDEPGGDTEGRGINNAGIVMGFAAIGVGGDAPIERFADGSIVAVTKDGAPLGFGIAGGINKKGIFVASGYDENFVDYLSFYGKNAAYTQAIAPPGFGSPHPRGINDSKDVTGFYAGGDGLDHGFVVKSGTASTLDYPDPGSTGTFLYGIDNNGTIAGDWSDSNQQLHSFTYDPSTSQFTLLERKHVKGGKFAQVLGGINNEGLIAVNFYAAGGSFIYCPRKPSKCPAGGIDIGPSNTVPARTVSHSGHRATLDPDRIIVSQSLR